MRFKRVQQNVRQAYLHVKRPFNYLLYNYLHNYIIRIFTLLKQLTKRSRSKRLYNTFLNHLLGFFLIGNTNIVRKHIILQIVIVANYKLLSSFAPVRPCFYSDWSYSSFSTFTIFLALFSLQHIISKLNTQSAETVQINCISSHPISCLY